MSGTGHEFTQRECDETYTYIKILLFPSPENLNRTTNNLHKTRKELVNFIVQKVEIKQNLKITPSTHQFLLQLNFYKIFHNFLDSVIQTLIRVKLKYSQ